MMPFRQAFLSGSLLAIILTNVGCSDDASLLERSFGISGSSYCNETHQVFDTALAYHLSKTSRDADEIYSAAISRLVDDIGAKIIDLQPGTNKAEVAADFSALKNEISNRNQESTANAELTSCAQFAEIQNLMDKHSSGFNDVYISNNNDKKGKKVQLFRNFLSEFAAQLDPFSAYHAPSFSSSRGGHGLGFSVDTRANDRYDIFPRELEVFATDFEETHLLRPHDKILAVTESSNEPIESSAKFESISEKFSSYTTMGIQNFFLHTFQPYLGVKVRRANTGQEEFISLSRRETNRKPLVSIETLDKAIIYARLLEFGPGAALEMERKLKTSKNMILSKDPATKIRIILDLRFNPGGDLNEMLPMANLFLDAGEVMIRRTRKNDESVFESVSLNQTPSFKDEKLFVLINHASASASDILTQILKESGRAIVIGETSFGKGIGQYLLAPENYIGGSFRVTAVEFMGPSGNSIYKKGITPDIEVIDPNLEALKKSCGSKCPPLRMADYEKIGLSLPPAANSPRKALSRASKLSLKPEDLSTALKDAEAGHPNDIVLETAKRVFDFSILRSRQ